MKRGRLPHQAVTLLELLIVATLLATLAILAAVHYQRAIIRSKVGRAKTDLAALRAAIELYSVDQLQAPMLAGDMGLTGALELLKRPEEYLADLPIDPFTGQTYQYLSVNLRTGLPRPYFGTWILSSSGPDQIHDTRFSKTILYNPTNGLMSEGDIIESDEPFWARERLAGGNAGGPPPPPGGNSPRVVFVAATPNESRNEP